MESSSENINDITLPENEDVKKITLIQEIESISNFLEFTSSYERQNYNYTEIANKLFRESNSEMFERLVEKKKLDEREPELNRKEIEIMKDFTGYNFSSVDSYYINRGNGRHYEYKGRCYDIGFCITFDTDESTHYQITKLEIKIQWQYENCLRGFIKRMCEKKCLNLFLERFHCFSYAVRERKRFWRELKEKYKEKVIITDFQSEETIYVKTPERIFFLLLEWKIHIDNHNKLIESLNCLPMCSRQHFLLSKDYMIESIPCLFRSWRFLKGPQIAFHIMIDTLLQPKKNES